MLKSLWIRILGWATGHPKGAASHLEELSTHLDAIFGPSTQHWHEIYSPDIHVDVIHYAPAGDRDFHYLVTSGVSDQPMSDGRRLELVIALPEQWDVSQSGFKDPATFAPVKLLKMLARYPQTNGTYFEKRHTIELGDSPEYAPLTAALLMPPVLAPELADPLTLRSGEEIEFLAIYLLHPAELELKLNGNLEELFSRFGDEGVSEIYDLSRPSVV